MGVRDTLKQRLLGRGADPGPDDAATVAPKSNWTITTAGRDPVAPTPASTSGLSEGVDALLAGVPVPPPPARQKARLAPLAVLASALDSGRHRRRGGDVRRLLNALGMLAIGFGIAAIVLGWYGASHSPYLFQEVPYVISGGILGLALVVGGAVLVISSWSLRQIQEERRNAQAMVRSVERLERLLSSALSAPMNGTSNPPSESVASRLPSSGMNQ